MRENERDRENERMRERKRDRENEREEERKRVGLVFNGHTQDDLFTLIPVYH